MSSNLTPTAPELIEPPSALDAYPLSPLQEGMLVHTLRDTGVGMYINQALYQFRLLDAEAFRKAWQQLVARHTILRSSFHWENLERAQQRVHSTVDVPFEIHDWGQISAEDYQAKLREFLRADRKRGFDLTSAPLLRIAVIRSSLDFQTVVWTNHHIILDGWSSPILLKEMRALYDAALGDEVLELPEPRPYREFIEWLERQDPVRTEAFWRNYLSGIRSPTPLPADQGSSEMLGRIQFGSWTLTLDAEETAALQTMARRFQVTLNNVVQGAWAILLSRYSGENDLVFGILVSGRPPSLEGVETMVGMFLNSVPLRVAIDESEPVGSWLRKLAATVGELQDYQHSPLLSVQEWSDVPPGTALFGSIVASKDTVERKSDTPTGSREDTIHATVQQNYPLHLDLTTAGGQLTMTLTYDSRRFAAPSVSRLMEQLGTVLRDMPGKVEKPLSRLSLTSEAERRRILEEWNETDVPVTRCLLHDLFTLQAARTPDNDAVRWRGDSLTYRELDERSNRLAHHLQARGVGPETLVGLCVPRSLEMAVGLLAILKAGGAYVPLDPKFPAERLEFMMEDSQAVLLLTAGPPVDALSGVPVPVVRIDEENAAWKQEPNAAPSSPDNPENLAYVLYTSGSTGQPKGVAIPHRVAVNRLQTEHDPFQPDEVLCAKTTLGFVDSIWELFSAWKFGSRVTLIPEEDLLDPGKFLVALRESEATRIVLVPSLLRLLLESDEPVAESVPRLKHWISSGEALPLDLCNLFAEQLPDRILTNLYGTSEVWDATRCDSRDFPEGEKLPIGRPMGNVRAYILDENLEPTPIGVQGELYIGGAGVARGYWRRPELTAEKFIPDPFSEQPGAKLYRTGDGVRWRSDGNIEYVGRLDQQFKLRGFRIEGSDIESTLRRHPAVSQAAVALLPGERLAAYYVALPGAEVPPVAALRAFAQEHLPEPMRPSVWIPLERMPLTPSGKIDRRALPEPEPELKEAPAEETAGGFQSETEQTIARIWSELLGTRIANRSENFFELGGHSLMATRAAVRLSKEVEVKVPLKSLFDFPTVSGLADWIEKAKDGPDESEEQAIPEMTKAERGREVPLSFSQRRLWFLDQLDPGSVSYTVPNPIRFHGPVDPDALSKALLEVVRRHESLRTTFVARDGEPFQVIHPAPDTLEIPLVDLSGLDEMERPAAAQQAARELNRRPWDLSRGPLFRANLIRISAVEHVLALTMHHIITDGRSMGVLAGEMAQLYRSIVDGHPSPLPPPAWQYADFAIWQRDWMRGDRLQEEIGYWKTKLGGAEILDLPTDHPRPAVHRYRGGRHTFSLDGATAAVLGELGRESGSTHFMGLLAGFTLFLSKFSGQRDISVGTPVASRNREELENIVGFFVNTLVMRSEIEGDPSFRELLESVRKTSIDAFAHQDVPFEKLVDALQPKRDLSRHPLFQVMFVHQEMAAEIRLPGMSWKHNPAELETSNFDLLLVTAETAEGVDCTLQYNSDLFDPHTVERMGRQLQRLFESAAQDPSRPISEISLLDPDERRTLLEDWSTEPGEPAEDTLLHALVERQCAEKPDAIAAESPDRTLTYGELDRQANRLAVRLQAAGAGPERVVAMFLDRSPQVLVCLLGILKSGAAFVSLDPSYPPERLKLMLETTDAPVLVTDRSLAGRVPESNAATILLEEDSDDSREPCDAPRSDVSPSSLAYVVFTSGSTGVPKGVMVEHHNVAAIVRAQIPVFQIDRSSRVLQMVSLSFDASVGEIFRALCAGATLVFESKDRLLPGPDLVDLLIGKEITAIALPPSALAVLPHDRPIPTLRTLTTGGEACPAEVAARWGKGRRMINGYGPSETTIGATAAVNWSLTDKPPLGRPLAGVTCYVLDARGEPVPAGFPGELYLGGIGVARGYLGRADLTAERFLPDPFSAKGGARLYRTGDLVRWLPNGDLDFLGRVDQQIKIRGFRVELGEIENVLASHPGVRHCVVDARTEENGIRRLVGYYVASGQEASPTPSDLRTHLQSKLPDYMVPQFFVPLDAIPVTVNGKLDRAALPAPTEKLDLGEAYVAPSTPTEEKLCGIWASLLGLEKVGVNDNFFEIGGDSILSIQMLARASQEGIDFTPKDLFQHQTVAELSAITESP